MLGIKVSRELQIIALQYTNQMKPVEASSIQINIKSNKKGGNTIPEGDQARSDE